MPRLVICRDLNTKKPINECFKAPNGKYYSSEAIYNWIMEDISWRNKCCQLYSEWVETDLKNSLWLKKMKEVQDRYKYETIYIAMLLSDEDIKWAKERKVFKNDYNRAAYYWAIVKGNLSEAQKTVNKKRQKEKEAKNRHEVVEDIPDVDEKIYIKEVNDISKFL